MQTDQCLDFSQCLGLKNLPTEYPFRARNGASSTTFVRTLCMDRKGKRMNVVLALKSKQLGTNRDPPGLIQASNLGSLTHPLKLWTNNRAHIWASFAKALLAEPLNSASSSMQSLHEEHWPVCAFGNAQLCCRGSAGLSRSLADDRLTILRALERDILQHGRSIVHVLILCTI